MSDKKLKQMNGYEIACVSSCVPATGDATLDAIISASLRFRTSSAMMEAMLANPENTRLVGANRVALSMAFERTSEAAVLAADALIAQFNKPSK